MERFGLDLLVMIFMAALRIGIPLLILIAVGAWLKHVLEPGPLPTMPEDQAMTLSDFERLTDDEQDTVREREAAPSPSGKVSMIDLAPVEPNLVVPVEITV